jgi:ubiquinone/menaquinone biosynthesis C-methylase UbiE
MFLDIGCGDAVHTKEITNGLGMSVYGVDVAWSKRDDINYSSVNIETEMLPFKTRTFDVVYINHVIEHVVDKDFVLAESFRVLKWGGLFICGTENVASATNILSLMLGQEPLSQHTSKLFQTASFLSPHFMKPMASQWHIHVNVCSYYGLQRLVRLAGFKEIKMKTAGLFPKIYNRLINLEARK